MVVSSANRKDKNEIVPCMVDKPINHLLKLLESCTAPLTIIASVVPNNDLEVMISMLHIGC